VDLSSTSAFTGQDSDSGSVESSATSITLTGNRWRYVDGATFTLTENTVVEFDFVADGLGEVQGISFDNDHRSSNGGILLNLAGTQDLGNMTYRYTGNGAVQHFSIPVGQHLTGTWQLVIVNDKDANPDTSTMTVSNVQVCEVSCQGAGQ
jgi:hypothetical protein